MLLRSYCIAIHCVLFQSHFFINKSLNKLDLWIYQDEDMSQDSLNTYKNNYISLINNILTYTMELKLVSI